ncbi:hypothetical protein KOW79_012201 [Hemibagrus wyckioides]|uniref:Uncharacterized protein n=1 Tax=Hemibagrus wyckioides TaxID=337641 RepID=A0A9D3SHK9_9TELE|nr:hypothetical protein KOW79_012201 [Hemibagrus wyckioides]
MDPGCKRVLKRIRPTRLMPKVSEDIEEEVFDPPSSPEDSYPVPLPPTPPATPQSSQQLSPTRSEESTISGHEEVVVVSGYAGEGPAGMEDLTLYAEEKCNSCRIRHPSQRQHTCLLDPPDDVFQTCFHGLVQRLWNPLFIRAVEKYMNSYGFCDPYGSEDISTMTVTLLLGYKSGGSIYDRIYRMYDDITPDEERMERFEKLIIDCRYLR